MGLIRNLKYKFSEPYRIKRGYGLSPIRNKRELKALIKFCEEQLLEEHIDLNPERKKIYQATIFFYRYYKYNKHGVMRFKLNEHYPKGVYTGIYDFIEDYSGWYWS